MTTQPTMEISDAARENGRLKQFLLNRIGNMAFGFPNLNESVFDSINVVHTEFTDEKYVRDNGQDTSSITSVTIDRDPNNPRKVLSVSAERYVADDYAFMHGITERRETFSSHRAKNELSIWAVFNAARRAKRGMSGKIHE